MTIADQQRQLATDFMALHHGPKILILPNAWDVVSGKIFELEGFKALGTTSAGISASLGYADGQQMSLSENLEVVNRIVKSTTLPVSADIEAGYAESVEGVVQASTAVLRAGAVGLNLEDSTGSPDSPLFELDLQKEKIHAIRQMSDGNGIHLVINARTDVYLVDGNAADNLRLAIERGNAYMEAGADCIFVPDVGGLDKAAITTLVKEIAAPINIVAGATIPPVAELQDIGVARVSLGPRPMRALLSLLREIAQELRATGTYRLMSKTSLSYSDINELLAGGKRGE